MKKLILSLATVLFAVLASSAFAGGPPAFAVSVSTDQYASWGQELVHDAIVTLGDGPAYLMTFDYNWQGSDLSSSSWTGFRLPGDEDNLLYAEGSLNVAPSLITGEIWSGANETRQYYQASFSLYGKDWGSRELTVKNSAGFPVILNVELKDGDNQTFWFNKDEHYNYALSAVPEPSSIVAMLSGLIGLGGFALRRRKQENTQGPR